MNPVIVVFLKWPEPGKVKTRLAQTVGQAEAVRIYRGLVAAVGRLLETCSGVDIAVCFDPPAREAAVRDWLQTGPFRQLRIAHWWPQQPTDLGGRQVAAVETALQTGYRKVALIGTDCVDWNAAMIRKVWEALDVADWVFGPALDGGYYLGALRASAPSASEVFAKVRWSSAHTLEDCLAHLNARGGVPAFIEKLKDVDDYEDWISVRDRVTLDP